MVCYDTVCTSTKSFHYHWALGGEKEYVLHGASFTGCCWVHQEQVRHRVFKLHVKEIDVLLITCQITPRYPLYAVPNIRCVIAKQKDVDCLVPWFTDISSIVMTLSVVEDEWWSSKLARFKSIRKMPELFSFSEEANSLQFACGLVGDGMVRCNSECFNLRRNA